MESKRSLTKKSKRSRRSGSVKGSTRRTGGSCKGSRRSGSRKKSPRCSSESSSDGVEKHRMIPPRKMDRLMVFYTIQKETPIGTVTKEIAKISMIKVWSDRILVQRDDKSIEIETIRDIVKEGHLRFTVKYEKENSISFQAHTKTGQDEWLKLLFRVWDDKKSEKRRLAQRYEILSIRLR